MVKSLYFELTYKYICHRKFPKTDQMHTFLKSFMFRSPIKGITRVLKIASGNIRLDVLSDTTLLKYNTLILS